MQSSSFGVKVVSYMGDAGFMGDQYQARASLGRGTDNVMAF